MPAPNYTNLSNCCWQHQHYALLGCLCKRHLVAIEQGIFFDEIKRWRKKMRPAVDNLKCSIQLERFKAVGR